MNTKSSPKTINMFAIFSLALVGMAFTCTTPAMAKIAAAFPDKNWALISTIHTLAVVPATLLSGYLAGQSKMKYRTLCILGSFLLLVGGIAPAWFSTSFEVILVFRIIMGLGLGLISPLGNALIIGLYEGQKQASFLGYSTLLMNFGGIVFQMAGGALADIQWNYHFYAFGFCIIAFALSFFIPEPAKREPVMEQGKTQVTKEKMTIAVFIIAFLFLIYNVLNFPVMMNLSLLFEDKGAGGATVAATALSLYTVSGCAAGLVYGKIFKLLNRFVIAFGFGLSAIGVFAIYAGSTALIMTIGCILIGFGFSCLMPTGFILLGMLTPASTVPMATSIVMALMNLGAFVCTYYLVLVKKIAGEAIYSPLLVETIIMVIITIFFVFYNPFPKKAKPEE